MYWPVSRDDTTVDTITADWYRRTSRLVRDPVHGVVRQRDVAGVDDFFRRPPVGPARCGRRSTAGGRDHRASAQGRVRRWALACEAFQLRTLQGMSIREIAERLDVGHTTVGKWLFGVPRMGGGYSPLGKWRFDRTAQD
jgi:DNA-directed RNA polymerase specialized sigma24 family protein